MVGGMMRITSLYSKATATLKGSDAAEGSEKRPRGRPKGQGKGGRQDKATVACTFVAV